jgi:hypothetical protein
MRRGDGLRRRPIGETRANYEGKAGNMRRFFTAMIVGGLVAVGQGGVTTVACADDGVNITRVEAYGTDTYSRYFRAGEVITIVVRGDGATDLDLYVTSPSHQLVALDNDGTDLCLVRFQAPASGFYTILVVNHGSRSNIYSIAVDGGTYNP